MWSPFSGRAQLPVPELAQAALLEIPSEFMDDGCSNSLDSIFGFDFTWACRIHDWRYCSRCHDPGSMTYGAKVVADLELKQHMRASLPMRWRWVRHLYKVSVTVAGGWGSWDGCGPTTTGERCRHNISRPAWM